MAGIIPSSSLTQKHSVFDASWFSVLFSSSAVSEGRCFTAIGGHSWMCEYTSVANTFVRLLALSRLLLFSQQTNRNLERRMKSGGKGGKEGGWNGTTRMAPSPVSETFTPSPELHNLPPNTRETIQLPFFNSVDNFCRSLSSPASLTSFHAVRLCSHGKLLPHCPLIRTSFPARTFFGLFALFKFFPSPLLDATTLTCPYFAT